MYKLIKSLVFILAVTSVAFSASIGMIDGHIVTGKDKREHAAICNAVIAVNCLKKQRASNYISEHEYNIRVKTILRTLIMRGLTVK